MIILWLSDLSMPSLEGDHRSHALIGLGQTTRSTGGYDLKPYDTMKQIDKLEFGV